MEFVKALMKNRDNQTLQTGWLNKRMGEGWKERLRKTQEQYMKVIPLHFVSFSENLSNCMRDMK